MSARALSRLLAPPAAAAAALSLLAGCSGGGGGEPGVPVLANPHAVEVLVERGEVERPPSDAPNRFYGGWIPHRVRGADAGRPERGTVLRAEADGASLQVVTLTPGRREMVLELVDDGRLSRLVHVRARIDRGEPFLVPVTDPLTVPLPGDLPAGRHLVELFPRTEDDPALLVAAARVRCGDRRRSEPGEAAVEEGELVQRGPSTVDVVAAPPAGTVLAGELCPSGGGRFAVEMTAAGGALVGRWESWGGALARLLGCRRFELPAARADGPVRVRFRASEPGSEARWRNLGWHGLDGAGGTEEETSPAAAPSFDPPRLVLVYVFDALRADHVGHLGGPPSGVERISPVLDRLAADGFTFRGHRTNAPNTLPSIRELFTGALYLDQAAWREVGMARPTLAELFQGAGYRTGLFSGNPYLDEAHGLARGFDHVSEDAYLQVLVRGRGGGAGGVNRNAEAVHAAALDWLDGVPAGEPVFLYLQTIHPHNPYAPPPAFERRFAAGIPSEIEGTTEVLKAIRAGELRPSPADRDRLRALYAASMAYSDAELGRFLEALAERVPSEETLALFTSDHGEELFDHGGVLHGYALWEELLRVPLVAWGPGRVRRGETGAPTDVLDLHATLAELAARAGAAEGRDEAVTVESGGRSLLPFLAGAAGVPPPGPRYAAAWGVRGGIVAVREGGWKLIRVGGTPKAWWMGRGPGRTWDRHLLFDLAADPGERENLAGGDSVRQQWLRALLRAREAELWAMGKGGGGEDEPALDPEARERLRALGYLD